MNMLQLFDGHPKKEVRLTYSRKLTPSNIQLEVEKTLKDSKPDTHSFSYKRRHESLNQLPSDVSSPIGLFTDIPEEYEIRENERLERCLADLFISMLFPHFKDPGTIILIQGPPLPKLIGRIGYRFPCPEITILFVTVDECFMSVPNFASDSGNNWDGPFPSLHEDSITRTFYFQHNGGKQVRVDVFCQGLEQFEVNEVSDDFPLGIFAKLDACKEGIIKFASDLRKKEEQTTAGSDGERSDLFETTGLASPDQGLAVAARSPSPKKSQEGRHAGVSQTASLAVPNLFDEEIYRGILGVWDKQLKHITVFSDFFSEQALGKFQDRAEFLRHCKRSLEKEKGKKDLNQQMIKKLWKEFVGGEGN